jgi:hypothetical protein
MFEQETRQRDHSAQAVADIKDRAEVARDVRFDASSSAMRRTSKLQGELS